MFGLVPDISLLDCRIKSGNDKKKNKSEYDREEAGDDRGKKDRI